MKKIKGLAIVIVLGLMFFLMGEKMVVWAGVRDNAYEYYSAYGNQAVFFPTTQTDGLICFCSSGGLSTSGIRYRTIGWKLDIISPSGSVVQSMYFQLGGAYMSLISDITVAGYEYKLYGIPLSSIKSRMDQNVYAQFAQGNCQIELNACMVVVKNGVLQGQMNDYGVTKGKVYTTLSGIRGAANWSASAQKALESYYGKNVQGLYYQIQVSGGEGIDSVSGGGRYCYGTNVTISALPADGYVFDYWDGAGNSSYYSFYVNYDTSFVAHARLGTITINYYRNWTLTDSVIEQRNYQVTTDGQQLFAPNWRKSGYHMTGWAYQRNSNVANLQLEERLSTDWLRTYTPAVSLYAMWTPNSYRFVFDGNGATGSVAALNGLYDRTITLPENGFAKQHASFRGWSLSKTGEMLYAPGSSVKVSELAERFSLESQQNAIITWYAIWDEAPSISGYDLYYSLEEAQNGKITEEELARRVSNYDLEDGVIAYGNHSNNQFLIRDYQAQLFTSCTENTVISVTFVVVDSAGNKAELPITIHIVDTKVYAGNDAYGKVRCIDSTYFLQADGKPVPQSKGGLMDNSIWLTQKEYKSLLQSVLKE